MQSSDSKGQGALLQERKRRGTSEEEREIGRMMFGEMAAAPNAGPGEGQRKGVKTSQSCPAGSRRAPETPVAGQRKVTRMSQA